MAALTGQAGCGSPPGPGISAEARQLNFAVEQGEVQEVKKLLQVNPNLVNAPDKYGETPLYNATHGRKNGLQVAAVLLAAGADVNAKEKNGFTPLYWAAWEGDPEMVKLLLAGGSCVDNRADPFNWPPAGLRTW
jgi:ankyrin repeat protein